MPEARLAEIEAAVDGYRRDLNADIKRFRLDAPSGFEDLLE
jgi:hypothetical protein